MSEEGMIKRVFKMRLEKRREFVKDMAQLKEYLEDEMIDAFEERNRALTLGNEKVFFYNLGRYEALRGVMALITDEGLLLYRFVPEEQPKKEEDRQGYQ